MTQGYEKIIYEKKERVAFITINRPEVRNACDPPAFMELARALTEFKDDDDAWVIIITGTGDKAFSAGADLSAVGGTLEAMGLNDRILWGVAKGLELWKPMIAAVNGLALGGGLEIALACDLRIAAEHATFGLPEVRWNFIPAGGGVVRLPRMMPMAKAMEMILMATRINAEEALQYGLINKVVPSDQLMPTAIEWANRICEMGPLAVRSCKEIAIRSLNMSLEDALRLDEHFLCVLQCPSS